MNVPGWNTVEFVFFISATFQINELTVKLDCKLLADKFLKPSCSLLTSLLILTSICQSEASRLSIHYILKFSTIVDQVVVVQPWLACYLLSSIQQPTV